MATGRIIPNPEHTDPGLGAADAPWPEIHTVTAEIGAEPSQTRVTTVKMLVDYVDEHSGGMPAWTPVTTGHAAAAGERLLADSTGGAFTITLPASPSAGDEIEIADPADSWASYNVTVSGGGAKIDSSSDDLILNVAGASLRLVYIDAAIGWAILQIC